MRCKCCDAEKTRWILGDFYCDECSSVIFEVIREDKSMEEEEVEYEDASE